MSLPSLWKAFLSNTNSGGDNHVMLSNLGFYFCDPLCVPNQQLPE